MKIDKNTVDMLTKMPDDKLWKIISSLGSSSGVDLSSVKVGPLELEKIRSALSQMTDSDITRALEILNSCKDGQGGSHGNR